MYRLLNKFSTLENTHVMSYGTGTETAQVKTIEMKCNYLVL